MLIPDEQDYSAEKNFLVNSVVSWRNEWIWFPGWRWHCESIWNDSHHVMCLLLDRCLKSWQVPARLCSDQITEYVTSVAVYCSAVGSCNEEWPFGWSTDYVLCLYPECIFLKNGGSVDCHFVESMIIFLHSYTTKNSMKFINVLFFAFLSSNIKTYWCTTSKVNCQNAYHDVR